MLSQENVQKLTKEEAEHYATELNVEQENKNYIARQINGDDWGIYGSEGWITTNDYWDYCFYL